MVSSFVCWLVASSGVLVQIFGLMNLIIDRLGDSVKPFAEGLLRLLPGVWQDAEGQSLLRIQVKMLPTPPPPPPPHPPPPTPPPPLLPAPPPPFCSNNLCLPLFALSHNF